MTATVPECTGTPRRLLLLPAPRLDGPYDDEGQDPPVPVLDGSLALAFPPPSRIAVPLRLVPPAAGDPRPSSAGAPQPDPRRWSARLAQAIAEVLAGARPPHQLADVAALDVLHLLERNAGRLVGHRGGAPSQPRVCSVHVSEPRPGAAEVCAVIDTGPRRRALAFRVEWRRDQWRCTAVHIG
jgi:hypothetical protein